MVNDIHLLKKQGVVIQKIAQELLALKKGDTIPNVSFWQEELGVARGTVQNALNYLKDNQAVALQSKGRLGTNIEAIDYKLLQEYALTENIIGTMTLPYSIAYEGMATGLYEAFQQANIKMNLAYIRGSKERLQAIETRAFQFAVVSRFAAKQAKENGKPLDIVVDFGDYTYLSQHVLVYPKGTKKLMDGMKVGIDFSSLDHQLLTHEVVKDIKVQLVDILGYQMLPFIIEGKLDAGVWNSDEVEAKYDKILDYTVIEGTQQMKDMTAAVIICHQDNEPIKTMFQRLIDKEIVLHTQHDVKNGVLMPKY